MVTLGVLLLNFRWRCILFGQQSHTNSSSCTEHVRGQLHQGEVWTLPVHRLSCLYDWGALPYVSTMLTLDPYLCKVYYVSRTNGHCPIDVERSDTYVHKYWLLCDHDWWTFDRVKVTVLSPQKSSYPSDIFYTAVSFVTKLTMQVTAWSVRQRYRLLSSRWKVTVRFKFSNFWWCLFILSWLFAVDRKYLSPQKVSNVSLLQM